MKILIIGEAWGRQEDLAKHAFVGKTGQLLAKLGFQSGLMPAVGIKYPSHDQMIDYWTRLRVSNGIAVTNVFNRHPDHDRIELFFDKGGSKLLPPLRAGKYILPEFMPDLTRLWNEIQTLSPNLILACGNSAMWATTRLTGISTYRGTLSTDAQFGIKVLPTYHPAAIMRQWSLYTTTLKDLERAKLEAEFPEIRRTERWITTLSPDSEGILTAWDWFQRGAERFTNDIETKNGLITMTSFARNPRDALVIQLEDPTTDSGSFWPTPRLEVSAWQLIRHGLRTGARLTFQNGMYDLSYYLRSGLVPRNCKDDTMLRHHAKFPELPKALGFLASIYSTDGPFAWKPMRHGPVSLKRDE